MKTTDEKRLAIASRLRLAREQAGLTQGQVARALGCHRPAISEIEAGRRGVPAEELATLAKTYGVSVNWLIDSDRPDPARDKLELAARELNKLKPRDLDRLLQLLTSLRRAEQ